MSRWPFLIFFCISFFLSAEISYAGAILRIKQMKEMRQQQAQEEYEQAILNQQQEQSQQQSPAKPTYEQSVDQRNQSIAQAILDAHHQTPSADPVQPVNNATTAPIPTASQDFKDVVDLSEVWKKLDIKSTVWQLLIDDQAKVLTVSEYIGRYQKEGVKISAPPSHYVQMIDQIAMQNPQMLQNPFGELLKILAIVDYDFDNGVDKDALARKVLGDAGYEANKKRFTQQAPGGNTGPR